MADRFSQRYGKFWIDLLIMLNKHIDPKEILTDAFMEKWLFGDNYNWSNAGELIINLRKRYHDLSVIVQNPDHADYEVYLFAKWYGIPLLQTMIKQSRSIQEWDTMHVSTRGLVMRRLERCILESMWYDFREEYYRLVDAIISMLRPRVDHQISDSDLIWLVFGGADSSYNIGQLIDSLKQNKNRIREEMNTPIDKFLEDEQDWFRRVSHFIRHYAIPILNVMIPYLSKEGAWQKAFQNGFGDLILILKQVLKTAADNPQSTALQRTQYSNIYTCVL